MALEFHVNGLAQLYVDIGTALAQSLGYSQDGVTISLHYETEDIHTDYYGSKIPEDIMNLGQWATVKLNLIKYDETVLKGVRKRLNGTNAQTSAEGLPPNSVTAGLIIGDLMMQCKEFTRLQIRRHNPACETTLEGGWKFGSAYLADVDSWKVGTRVTVHDLTFRCLPDASGVLYSIIGTATPS
jgi:hypothetical protein